MSTSTPISTTSAFVGSIGVNVHVEYTDGKYADAGKVISDLRYLGVSAVRDAVLNPGNQGQASYDALAAAGIKFDFFLQGTTLASSFALVDAFASRHAGSILAIEGPNEVNNFPISYAGLSGDAAAVKYQTDLYAKVHADGALAGVPVYNLTSWPDLAGAADFANFHSYPKNGSEPLAQLSADLNSQLANNPNKAPVLTEAGYTTTTGANYYGGVDEQTQAKLILNLLADSAKLGVQQTFLYELLDAYSDPSGSDPEKHFGLFHLDNSPKAAATAIHNFTSILSAAPTASVSSAVPSWSLSGLPASGSSLALTKAAGVSDLLLWAEPQIWNPATNSAIAVAPSTVAIHFGAKADVSIFDPLTGVQSTRSFAGVQDITVDISDHPVILEIRSSASSAEPIVVPPVSVTPSPVPAPVVVAPPVTATPPQTVTSPSTAIPISAPTSTGAAGVGATVTQPSTPAGASAPPSDNAAATELQANNLLRLPAAPSSTAPDQVAPSLMTQQAAAAAIGSDFSAGRITADDAQSQLHHLVDGTTTVASLSYAYFTGKTPTAEGLNYLVNSPVNPTDLNDAYYSAFSTENRFINFAVALAKGGDGAGWATPQVTSESLSNLTAQVYGAIFGTPASAAKVSALLDAQVPDGLGGSETRAQYLAGYGGDGLNGVGTKAALVGWLLAASVSEGQGVYQDAQQNFLSALAHGTAQFGTDLLATYGNPPTLVGQVALDVSLGH